MDAPDKYSLGKEAHASAIFLAQVRMIFEASTSGTIIQVIVPMVLAFVQRTSTSLEQSFPLLVYFLLIAAFRVWIVRRYNQGEESPSHARRWLNYYMVSLALLGLGYTMAAILYIPGVPAELQIFTALVLGGVASGAVVSLFPTYKTYLIFVIPTNVPAIILFFAQYTELSITTGLLATILTLFLIATAKRMNDSLMEQTRLSVGYQMLFEDLSVQISTTDRLNEELAAEIEDRRVAEKQLLIAMRETEMASKAKSEFLSAMSHELRTPLNSILGYAQLLMPDFGVPDKARVQQYTKQIIEGGEILLDLITQVLNYAEQENNPETLKLEPTNVVSSLKSCIAVAGSRAAERNIHIEISDNPGPNLLVLADEPRLHQIFMTLLSNAVKYNRADGRVDINAEDVADNFIRISISDTGTGIPDYKLESLFEPFNRLGHEMGKISGVGLGLATTKRIVETLNGRIDVDTTVNQGSTFWVELPRATQTDQNATANIIIEPTVTSPALDKFVICVEDDRANMRLTEEVVSQIDGISFKGAINSEEASLLIEERLPDLILMDVNLSGVSGIQYLNTLRKNDRTKKIPVIALSAGAMPADIERGRAAGFDQYLTKPIEIGHLESAIRSQLSLEEPKLSA